MTPSRSNTRTRQPRLAAGARGVAAGLVGTTVMTVSLKLEERARRRSRGPVDYDASDGAVALVESAGSGH